MKHQKKSILLAVSVLAIFLFSAGGARANEYLKIPYVTHGNGWSTGIAVTNFSSHTITDLYCDFTHQDGSFFHVEALAHRDDRANMGDFAPGEMKVFALDELYAGAPLPAGPFWLWFFHNDGNYPFGVAVFIMNDFAGIGGYGFQQFTSTFE